MTLSLTAAPTLPDLNDPATFNPRALSLFSWMTGTFIGELEAIEASDYFSVQSSVTDATSGVLMLNGAWGAGNTGSLANIGDWDATGKPGGLYLFSATTANLASKPAAYADGQIGLVRIERYSADYFAQTCWRIATDAMPFMRRYQNGTWSAWERVFISSNTVGTVSQSGGTPTGAIIERGSNANGSYTRWADGTQLCWNGNTAIATAPAAFAGTITKIDGDKLWIGRWF